MKTRMLLLIASAMLLLVACKGEKKMVQYSEVYRERPAVIYIAPIEDKAEHRAQREMADSVYNASLNTATQHLYLTASSPLVHKGYYVLGPLASARLAAAEKRTLKQLRNENINDYFTDLGVDAILFITVKNWKNTHNQWCVELEYTLRSAENGTEIMHTAVDATKLVGTDFHGNPRPLREDLEFADIYGCDVETAQRCRLVEKVNEYVLSDLPAGKRSRGSKIEPYVKTHAEYFTLHINPDGSVMVVPPDSEL